MRISDWSSDVCSSDLSFAPVPATGGFADALRGLGHSLETDERLNGAVNGYARRAVVGAINDYGGTVVTLVSDTIRSWSARTVTDRLEAAVGRAPPYLSINGTLAGRMAGLHLHPVTVLS